MAKRKQIITVKTNEFKLGDILMNIKGTPTKFQIAAMTKVKKAIEKVSTDLAQLKAMYETIEQNIVTASYDDVIDKMMKEGDVSSPDLPVVVSIEDKDGSVYEVAIKKATEESFEINPSLSSGDTFDALDPKYKKVTESLDKKLIKDEFESGVLPPALAMFCEKNIIEGITKLSKPKLISGPTTPAEEDIEDEKEE